MKIFRSPLSKLPEHSRFNYKPRYYDPEKEEREKRKQDRRIRMERNSLYKNSDSKVVGAFTNRFEDDYFAMEKRSKFRQLSGTFLLAGIMVVPLACVLYGLPLWVAIPLCLFLVYLYKKR